MLNKCELPIADPARKMLTPRRQLRRSLSTFGMLMLTLSCLSPAFSIYGIGVDVLQHAGGAAAGLFVVAMVAAVIWAFVYAELGSAYPCAGGDYVGISNILGPCIGFVALVIWVAISGPAAAFEAQVVATYVKDLIPGLSHALITAVSLAAALLVALMAVRASALVTGFFLAVEMLVVLVLVVCGLSLPLHGLGAVVQASVALPSGAGPGAALVPVTMAALTSSLISTVYGTVGGNQAIGFGEELQDPHRLMGRVIILACLIGAATTAIPVIVVSLAARDLPALMQSPAPFTAFVEVVAGRGISRAVDAGVALALFNALIVQIMWSARLFFSLGRDGVLTGGANRLLASVHAASGAPRGATIVVTGYTALCCLAPTHILLMFLAGSVVFTFGLVCFAVLFGRGRGLTALPGYWRSAWFPLAPVLGLLLVATITVADLADPYAGRPSLMILGGIAGLGAIWYAVHLRRRPGGWTPTLEYQTGRPHTSCDRIGQ